jgi:hypothetical protein
MMTRRDWWIGIALLTATLLVREAWPRYVWRHVTSIVFVREDRWRGTLERGTWDPRGRWIAVREQPTQMPPQLQTPLKVESFEPLKDSTPR